jgi:nicotinate-nucleotide pyrophosphorylase (carboxylating)
MQLTITTIRDFLDKTLSEDTSIGGDITTNATIDPKKLVEFSINVKNPSVISGLPVADYFWQNHSSIKWHNHVADGDEVGGNAVIIEGSGYAYDIMKLERVVLNYLQHLSGVATLTQSYVKAISHTKAKITDTRKTIPGMRLLQKYAVKCGGGNNHRFGLDSSILIKDNHIAICGSITEAITRAKIHAPHWTKIEIECDTVDQVHEAASLGIDVIMLDNMSVSQIKESLAIINGRALVEVSGGVNLSNIRGIAETGVNIISIGRLTHSVEAVDIGLDIF